MKKLMMFVMVLVLAAPAMALKYPDFAPDFTGCDNSAWVIWEFTGDVCYPTSDNFDPPYGYFPEPEDTPTFGGRHWDDPTEDSGWGGSYGADLWTYSNGAYTVLAEDSFNQSIPESGEKPYLRQYFQVVHTLVPGLEEDDYQWPIGVGLELWNMSVYEGNGWTGCPVGYETLAGDGFIGGADWVPPQIIDHGDGWYTSVFVNDFDDDGSLITEFAETLDLEDATHTACIIGMDLAPDEGQTFQVEEVILDFIWFSEPDGSDIPAVSCEPRPSGGVLDILPSKPNIYEPQDAGGPLPMGDPCEVLQIKLQYRPSVGEIYPDFNCTVVVDPDPNQENAGDSDFSIINPVPPDPNGNVYLTFTQDNWDTYQNVVVKATADIEEEGDDGKNIELTVTIDIADCNFGGPGCGPVKEPKTMVIVDNDIPYISVLPYGFLLNVLTENDPCVPRCVDVSLSHLPTGDVYVFVSRESDYDVLLESMSVMDPPLDSVDPNRLTFTPTNGQPFVKATMTSGWNVSQSICLEARDDDIRKESLNDLGLEWVLGKVLLNGSSDDIRYQSSDEGGTLKETFVNFNVQDNDCGTWGYDFVDTNKDCVIDLSDIAALYGQWTMCTEPYDADYKTWGDCAPLWEWDLE